MMGEIECFVVHNDIVYVIAKKIVSLFNSYYTPLHPEIRSDLFYCYMSGQLIVEELNNLTKIVHVQSTSDNFFVSLFKSSHLFT